MSRTSEEMKKRETSPLSTVFELMSLTRKEMKRRETNLLSTIFYSWHEQFLFLFPHHFSIPLISIFNVKEIWYCSTGSILGSTTIRLSTNQGPGKLRIVRMARCGSTMGVGFKYLPLFQPLLQVFFFLLLVLLDESNFFLIPFGTILSLDSCYPTISHRYIASHWTMIWCKVHVVYI